VKARGRSLGARLTGLILLAGLPGSVLAVALLAGTGASRDLIVPAAVCLCAVMAFAAHLARQHVERPLRTVANLLSAMREGDYSFRARAGRRGEALGEVANELNRLADLLKTQRLGALEATALMRAVLEEIDVAVFAFDAGDRLRLMNRAGERALGRAAEQALGRQAAALGLAEALAGEAPRVVEGLFGRSERWTVRRGAVRQEGRPHRLLVLTDVSRELRDEERQAWQRLIRVLGHEINNSLTPIVSIAGSLRAMAGRQPLGSDPDDDLARGLEIIEQRAGALGRFTEAYARIARLPPPAPTRWPVAPFAARVAALVSATTIVVEPGPAVDVLADEVQCEQAVINLLRNAVDAVEGRSGAVGLRWRAEATGVAMVVEDEGPGVASTANLFVPFFTTRPGGTGVGLVLSRQIAEQNRGRLTLANRAEGGARATLWLPRA